MQVIPVIIYAVRSIAYYVSLCHESMAVIPKYRNTITPSTIL